MKRRNIYHIRTATFGTFNSLLAGLGRNRVNSSFCSAHKPVHQSRKKVLRAYCPNVYYLLFEFGAWQFTLLFFGLICGLFNDSIAAVAPEAKQTKCGLKIEIPIKTT